MDKQDLNMVIGALLASSPWAFPPTPNLSEKTCRRFELAYRARAVVIFDRVLNREWSRCDRSARNG